MCEFVGGLCELINDFVLFCVVSGSWVLGFDCC